MMMMLLLLWHDTPQVGHTFPFWMAFSINVHLSRTWRCAWIAIKLPFAFFFQCCFVLKKKLEIERDVLNAHRSICCYCILLTFWHYSTSRMYRQAAEDDVVSHDATNQTHIYMLSHDAVKGVQSILFLGWTFFYLFLWCGLFYLEFFNIHFSSILIQLKAVKLKWSSSWFYYFDQNKIYCLE